MPFIVTTRRTTPPIDLTDPDHVTVTRRAVAALEGEDGARDVLQPIVRAVAHPVVRGDLVRIVERWDGADALFLRLPHGVEVEVEARQWYQLAEDVGWDFHRDAHRDEAELLAAYNAEQGA